MSYVENRVRVSEYGSLPKDSPLLVPVPTSPGRPQQRAHVLVARALPPMAAAVHHDLGLVLLFDSGWRPHRWTSFAAYRAALVAQYGPVLKERLRRPVSDDEAFRFGQLFRAFDSPHETGLALDVGCGGMAPISKTIPDQRKTKLYGWLVDHMWEYGFTPYLREPWHIELRVPLDAYRTPPDGPVPAAPPAEVLACEGDECCEADHEREAAT